MNIIQTGEDRMLIKKRDRINNEPEIYLEAQPKIESIELARQSFSNCSGPSSNLEKNAGNPTIKFRIQTDPSNISNRPLNNTSNGDKTKFACNSNNSQCLKLYCECFATMLYCDPKICNCRNCGNTIENEVSIFLTF